MENASDERSRAWLLASSTYNESGTWLDALVLSHCGLDMHDENVRVAVGLRLGGRLCYPTSVIIVGLRSMTWTFMASVAGGVRDSTLNMLQIMKSLAIELSDHAWI